MNTREVINSITENEVVLFAFRIWLTFTLSRFTKFIKPEHDFLNLSKSA